MPWTREDLLAAARTVLLRPDAVTAGFHGEAVTVEDNELVVRFMWRRHPRRFQIRLPLEDLPHGSWTGMPTSTPLEWVHEISGLLMEELDTGAMHWAARRERDGVIELNLSAGPPLPSAYYISDVRPEAAQWLAEQGLEVEEAVGAERSGALMAWLQMYVDNARGEPTVGHVVIVRGPDPRIARLAQLQIVAEVPLADSTRLAHHALCTAAEAGAVHIVSPWQHPALIGAGMQISGQGLQLDARSPWPVPAAVRQLS